jgi:UDP-2,4-diacetamido-2,4,6-trideoxy-beta-L-altropyranose hydrolase
MYKLVVLTDAGAKFGFGHLTRTLSIVEHFYKNNFQISYIVDGDNSIESFLSNYPYDYQIFSWKENQEQLQKELEKIDYILIDSLEITPKQLKYIEQFHKKIIFFDDEKRKNILQNGFVIDWTILSDEKGYFEPRKKDVTYFLGSKYVLLRKEFQLASKNQLNPQIKSIMISFGGSDVRNLTPKVLEFFVQNYPKIEKNIIIGAGFTNIDKIKQVSDKNTNLLYNLDANDMIKTMQTNDIAISAGGQTLYELAMIGIPTIAPLLVDNAKDDTFGWRDVGFLEYIGWYDDINLIDNLQLAFEKLQSLEVRKNMIDRTSLYLPNKESKILVDEIIGAIK